MQDGAQKLSAAAAGQQSVGSSVHNENTETARQGARASAARGLEFSRFFSPGGQDRFDQV